ENRQLREQIYRRYVMIGDSVPMQALRQQIEFAAPTNGRVLIYGENGEDKEGKFSQADAGTLFLDEVGDMSLKTQAKVLRVLEDQRFTPVGGNTSLTVDVRVIASTNKGLEREIELGNFREDL